MPQELQATVDADDREPGQTAAGDLELSAPRVVRMARLTAEVAITNLAGHKLPTAYPRGGSGSTSPCATRRGRPSSSRADSSADGSIAGNDNDATPRASSRTTTEISQPDQVQIYEPILADPDGRGDHGARCPRSSYVKDNRLLPEGFDKATAEEASRCTGRQR